MNKENILKVLEENKVIIKNGLYMERYDITYDKVGDNYVVSANLNLIPFDYNPHIHKYKIVIIIEENNSDLEVFIVNGNIDYRMLRMVRNHLRYAFQKYDFELYFNSNREDL